MNCILFYDTCYEYLFHFKYLSTNQSKSFNRAHLVAIHKNYSVDNEWILPRFIIVLFRTIFCIVLYSFIYCTPVA